MKDQTPKCLDVTLDKAEVKHAAGEMERVHKGKLQGEVGALSEESDDIRMPLTQIIESTHFSENMSAPKAQAEKDVSVTSFPPSGLSIPNNFHNSQFTFTFQVPRNICPQQAHPRMTRCGSSYGVGRWTFRPFRPPRTCFPRELVDRLRSCSCIVFVSTRAANPRWRNFPCTQLAWSYGWSYEATLDGHLISPCLLGHISAWMPIRKAVPKCREQESIVPCT
jgi:hypothetical protein